MSDIKKEAILTLKIDEGTFNQDILKTTRNIEELKKERELYSKKQEYGIKLTEEEVLADKKLEAQIKANQTALRSLQKITQLQTEANLAQKGSVDQLSKQYKAAELELKRLGGTVERGADGQLRLTGAYKENEVAANQVFQTLKEYDALLGKHNLNVGNYGSVLTKLKQQISDLDQQRSIATDPEEVMRLTTEIRKLTLQQDQYLGKVDELGNRVAKNDIKDGFQDANGAVGALSSGLFLLTLGMDDNSKAGEILQKVMIGVTVAQTALSIAQSKADIAGTISTVRLGVQTAAQRVFTFAVGASTGALKAFRVALLTTGIGAVVVGIAVLIDRMSSLKRTTNDNSGAQKELNDRLKENQEMFDKIANATAEQDQTLKRTIELRKAQGASYHEIHNLNKELLQDEINNIDKALQMHGTLENAGDLINRKIDAQNELKILEAEYYKEVNDNYLEIEKKRREEDNKYLDTIHLLTVAEKKRLDQQIKSTFIENPNVQDAFQKLIGVDDATFTEIWAQVGTSIDNTTQGIVGVAQAQENVNNTEKEHNLTIEEGNRLLKEREAAIYQLGGVMSSVFQGAFADADDAQKQFFKNAVIGLLDYLQKFIMEKKIEAVVSQLASKGFLGVITGAAIVGLIDGAFAVAKSQITGYAEGGLVLPEHGIPIQRDNGDNRLATIKTGEVIMNDTHQSRLKQVAGVDIFKKLGIPGFANGGVMDGGFAYRSATSKVNDGIEMRQVVYEAVRNMPPQVLYISDLERMQNSRDKAVNVMSINK